MPARCWSPSTTAAKPPGCAATRRIPSPADSCAAKWRSIWSANTRPDRLLYPMRRVGAKGEGRFERISWDEALDEIAARLQAIAAEFGAGIHPALQLCRHHGTAERLRHGPALLSSPGRIAARPHHLLGGGRRRPDRRAGLPLRHRARAVPPLQADYRVGREHARHQRASVAVHRGSAPQRREVLHHRSAPQSHGRGRRQAFLHQSGQRHRAGAGHDARHHRREAARRRLRRAAYHRVRRTGASACGISAGARRRAHRHRRRTRSWRWRASTPPPGPPRSG